MRLAMGGNKSKNKQTRDVFYPPEQAPTVRLAVAGGSSENSTRRSTGFSSTSARPALLVSFYYLEPFLELRQRGAYHYRDWVMDSGAFSAHNSGKEIRLQDYIDACKRLRDEDPTLSEVFALDVIGDWRATMANTEEMWRQGVEAIPCFHAGSPEDVLRGMARDYPKVALGGVALSRGDFKMRFAEQCFARVWPAKIHGFGYGSERAVMSLPFHSVDATNWELGPCKFGNWQAFGDLSVRGSKQNLRAEVEWYLALERRARARWAKTWAALQQPAGDPPAIRLACNGSNPGETNGSLACETQTVTDGSKFRSKKGRRS